MDPAASPKLPGQLDNAAYINKFGAVNEEHKVEVNLSNAQHNAVTNPVNPLEKKAEQMPVAALTLPNISGKDVKNKELTVISALKSFGAGCKKALDQVFGHGFKTGMEQITDRLHKAIPSKIEVSNKISENSDASSANADYKFLERSLDTALNYIKTEGDSLTEDVKNRMQRMVENTISSPKEKEILTNDNNPNLINKYNELKSLVGNLTMSVKPPPTQDVVSNEQFATQKKHDAILQQLQNDTNKCKQWEETIARMPKGDMKDNQIRKYDQFKKDLIDSLNNFRDMGSIESAPDLKTKFDALKLIVNNQASYTMTPSMPKNIEIKLTSDTKSTKSDADILEDILLEGSIEGDIDTLLQENEAMIKEDIKTFIEHHSTTDSTKEELNEDVQTLLKQYGEILINNPDIANEFDKLKKLKDEK